MAWKCPGCGVQHEDVSQECSCGYSLYKILGIKPGASVDEAKQSYKYLRKVWQADRSDQDPLSKKKAEDRLKKINEAFEIFRKNSSESSADMKKSSFIKIAVSAGAVFILLLGVLAFSTDLFKSDKTIQSEPSQKEKTGTSAVPLEEKRTGVAPGVPSPETSQSPVPLPPEDTVDENAAITEERAVEIVKKSRAIFGNFSTDSILKKWTEDNSTQYQMIGWKAKKMDEENYLVSYTAMNGAAVKGFYFNLNTKTRHVENLENNPDLQKKYNIKYSQ